MSREESVHYALWSIEYAASLAISLLYDLDTARAHIRTLKPPQDGRMVVCPESALALNRAVETAFRDCRNIEAEVTEKKTKKRGKRG